MKLTLTPEELLKLIVIPGLCVKGLEVIVDVAGEYHDGGFELEVEPEEKKKFQFVPPAYPAMYNPKYPPYEP